MVNVGKNIPIPWILWDQNLQNKTDVAILTNSKTMFTTVTCYLPSDV